MYHVSAQGVDEHMINVHYYYYYNARSLEKLSANGQFFIGAQIAISL